MVARDFSDFLLKDNENVEMIEFDVSCISEIKMLAQKIGYVDVLVNNAGIMYSLPYNEYPEENKERLMNVNLYAPIEFITQFSDEMIKKK